MDIITRRLLDKAEPICSDSGAWNNGRWDTDPSDTLTKLIQETGRLVDHRASEILTTLRRLDDWLKDRYFVEDALLFGLHKSGVDDEAGIRTRLESTNSAYGLVSSYYREVYAIHGHIQDENLIIDLKSIGTGITELCGHREVPYISRFVLPSERIDLVFNGLNGGDEPEACLYLHDGTVLKVTHLQPRLEINDPELKQATPDTGNLHETLHVLTELEKDSERFLIRRYRDGDRDEPDFRIENHEEPDPDSMQKRVKSILIHMYNDYGKVLRRKENQT